MVLLSVLLWCIYPLAPAKRLYELTRYALQQTISKLSDQRWIDWLCADPDDPRGIATFERWIDNLNASIDLLIHLRARELLGLPNHDWTPPRQHELQPRRSRSFEDLWRRLELCVLKFGDLERLAACRAKKLERLYADMSLPRSADEIAITAWRAATATTAAAAALTLRTAAGPRPAGAATPLLPTTATTAVSGSARTRAGMRVRAPPWLPTPYSPLPIPRKRQLPGTRALASGHSAS